MWHTSVLSALCYPCQVSTEQLLGVGHLLEQEGRSTECGLREVSVNDAVQRVGTHHQVLLLTLTVPVGGVQHHEGQNQ